MTAPKDWLVRPDDTRYVIDGLKYASIKQLFGSAKSRGYTGCAETLRHRVKAGATTWVELLKMDESLQEALKKRTKERLSKKAADAEEMRRLCEELDSRKQTKEKY